MYSFNSSFKKRYKKNVVTSYVNKSSNQKQYNVKINAPNHLNGYISVLDNEKAFDLKETLSTLSKYYLTTNLLNEKQKSIALIKQNDYTKQKTKNTKPKETPKTTKVVSDYYVPKFKDTLLWCWMRFQYGTLKTEFITNTGFKEEQEERIKLIQFIKENKSKTKKKLNMFRQIIAHLI